MTLNELPKDVTDYFMIHRNFLRNTIIGLIVGLVFIGIIASGSGISIGFPLIPQASEGERFVAVTIGAPIGEEVFFRGMLMPVIDAFIPIPLIHIPIQAGIFGFFHIKAYAGSFDAQAIKSVSGAITGAILFGLIMGTMTAVLRNIWPSIIAHAMVNGYLVTKTFIIIAG